MLVLRAATAADASRVRALLEAEGLPTSDLDSAQPDFVLACEGERLLGIGALQRFGTIALLRSVAVVSNRRGSGIGLMIVRDLEQRASAARITELVLLTQTAKQFFEHQGYRVVDRAGVSQVVQASEEFRSLCPASATCMSKTLRPGTVQSQ